MKYLLLIYDNEHAAQQMTAEEAQADMQAYFALDEKMRAAGLQPSGEALEPSHTAKSVRVREGSTTTTDGPFAETVEQLGGFYLIEAPDLDAAVAWAEQIPAAKTGTIEVRPVMDLSGH